jgi:hypothetical protein
VATLTKLYTDTPQEVPPQTWTVLRFEKALRDDGMWGGGGMTDPASALITPQQDGDFIWFRFLHWASITVPAGDTRQRQFLAQFVRDPYGVPDSTGTADHGDTAGREFQVAGWQFAGRAGQPVAVRVWHDHHEPVDVLHAQFVGMTWDH